MFVTVLALNSPRFAGMGSNVWTVVGSAVPQGNGMTAYYYPAGQTTTFLSMRADDTIAPAQSVGANEQFKRSGNVLSVVIGEGVRALGCMD